MRIVGCAGTLLHGTEFVFYVGEFTLEEELLGCFIEMDECVNDVCPSDGCFINVHCNSYGIFI